MAMTTNCNMVFGSLLDTRPLVTMCNINKAIDMTGNLTINGSLNATGTKNFKIPHPVIPHAKLIHSAVEAPRMDLIYRGRATLQQGRGFVCIDKECNMTGGMTTGTFQCLVKNAQVFVCNNESWVPVMASLDVAHGALAIYAKEDDCNVTVDWMVIGERNDIGTHALSHTDHTGSLVVEPRN